MLTFKTEALRLVSVVIKAFYRLMNGKYSITLLFLAGIHDTMCEPCPPL